jgi:hypothetical protein
LVIDPKRLGASLKNLYANPVLVTDERDLDRVYVGGELRVEHGEVLQQGLAGIQKEADRRALGAARKVQAKRENE